MTTRRGSDLTVTDMFCGAGGSSIGAEAGGATLRMGLNHWARAIETHALNFQHADHDCTDVSATNPRRYPRTDILLASPECTNHSLAKGAKRKGLSQYDAFVATTDDPAAERSRATMWDVVRFAEHHRYQVIIVENVVDVRHWEPFNAWLQAMDSLGYQHRAVYLNSMFAHPTPQSRDRIYVVFWRKGNRAPDLDFRPAAWCTRCEKNVEGVQSWKPGRSAGRYRQQYVYACPACATEVTPYYYAALNAIDWSIPAERIGDRKKPLRPRTLERIRYGLDKYGRQPLQIITNMTTDGGRVRAVIDPLHTQTGSMLAALVRPPLLINTRNGQGIDCRVRNGATDPLGTQTATGNDFAIAIPPAFLLTYRNYEGSEGYPLDGLEAPLRTATTNNQYRLIINGAALMTMRDSDRPEQLVRELTDAMHTQATMPQMALIQRQPYLFRFNRTMNVRGVGQEMFTVDTRDRLGLVQPQQQLEVDDCYFRMLKAPEIGAGMAFPSDYQVTGNASEQVKQYGNAVTPPAMRDLMQRAIDSLTGERAA